VSEHESQSDWLEPPCPPRHLAGFLFAHLVFAVILAIAPALMVLQIFGPGFATDFASLLEAIQ
jgi:hypothetical protein